MLHKHILLLALLISIYSNAQIRTGKLEWKHQTQGRIIASPCLEKSKFTTGKPIRSSAATADGKVFFGCDDGNIYALDATRGDLLWKFSTKGERHYDMWDYYRSSPVLSKGRLYIGSGDGNIYAIDATNGKELWHFTTAGIVHADPALSNDTLYIGSFDGNFYALNGITGKPIWKFKTIGDRFFPKGEIQKAALVTNDAVYFGSRDYNIYALNRSTGAGLWNMKEYGSWIIATPYRKGNRIFFGTSDTHAFYSLNDFYGEIQWKAALPMRSYNTPAGYDTLIFTGCFDGCVYGFGQTTGNIQWKFQTDGSKKNYAAVYDSTGHFRKDFTIYGNDSITVASEQRIMDLGAVLSTTVIREGILYFGSADGCLYAVKITP